MIEKRIYSGNECDKQIRELYENAFPKEEQIPFDDLMLLLRTMSLDLTAYYDGDEFVGFTVVYPRATFNWFWYFAVKEHLRGRGYGQTILSLLIERYCNGMNILDMESPTQECANIEQRRRRYAFYKRNGFVDTGVGKSFDGIDYTILMNGKGEFTMCDYEAVLNELRSFWASMPTDDNQTLGG